MSTEKKQPNFLKVLQKTFNLQIPIFLEGKEGLINQYFLRKVGITSNEKLTELLHYVKGFSGFFDPNQLKVVYGKEINKPITLQMIASAINRYKEEGQPDWVVLDDAGFLQFNPDLSHYLDKQIQNWVPFSKERSIYHTGLLLTRLCQLLNMHYGSLICDEHLKSIEKIDYEQQTKLLEEYFPKVTAQIEHLKTQLGHISKTELQIQPTLEEYLKSFNELDNQLVHFDQYLGQLRTFEKRFGSIHMSLDVDLTPFTQIKEEVEIHTRAVHAINQHLGMLDQELDGWDGEWNYIFKETRPKLQLEIENYNDRYQKILNDPHRIYFYQKLNNPENEIKRELKNQRERLETRVKNIQWAKRSIDDKQETLKACRLLYEKLSRNTDDISVVEIDSAFMDQDAYHFNLKALSASVVTYLNYLNSEHERVDKQIKGAFPQEIAQWNAHASRLKSKIQTLTQYSVILDDVEKSAHEKIEALRKQFKKDKKILQKDSKYDLNKETQHFIKRISCELLEAQQKKLSNPSLEEFELSYRQLKLETDDIKKLPLRNKCLKLIENHVKSFSTQQQEAYYLEMVKFQDSQNDAKSLGWYCQSHLIKPKAVLLDEIRSRIRSNDRAGILYRIKQASNALEGLLIRISKQDEAACQLLLDALEKEMLEMKSYQGGISQEHLCLEIDSAFARYFQFYDLIKRQLAFRSALSNLEKSTTFDIQEVARLTRLSISLRKEIEAVNPDLPFGEIINIIPLEKSHSDALLKVSTTLLQQFESIPGVLSVQRFEEVKKQISKHLIQKRDVPPIAQLDELLSLKLLLRYRKSPALLEALRTYIQNNKNNADFLTRFTPIELAKLRLMEILLQVEETQNELVLIDIPASIILQEQLNQVKGHLIQGYNHFILEEYKESSEIEGELTKLEELASREQVAIKEIYMTHIEQQLQHARSVLEKPQPQDFLEWLFQKLITIRQSLFGKSAKEKEKEETISRNIQTFERLDRTKNSFSCAFFAGDKSTSTSNSAQSSVMPVEENRVKGF